MRDRAFPDALCYQPILLFLIEPSDKPEVTAGADSQLRWPEVLWEIKYSRTESGNIVAGVFAPVLANTRSQFAETSRGGGSVAFRPPSDGRKSTVSSGGPAGAAIQLERFVGDHPDRRER